MGNLAGVIARRRWLVIGAWVAIVAFSLPLAARQTEDLSGGGFDVPGSQSEAVEKAVTNDFTSSDRGRLALALQPQQGLGSEAASAAVDRTAAEIAAADGASVAPGVAARAKAELAAGRVAVVPIDAKGDSDTLTNADGKPVALATGSAMYLPGRPASLVGVEQLGSSDADEAGA